MPKRFLERFRRIDHLIRIRGTGTPAEFAKKLDLSESMLFEYLNVLKDEGAPISYDKFKKFYYYEVDGSFRILFEEKH
jgi:hypothetical protein